MASVTPDSSYQLPLIHVHYVTVGSLQKPVGQTHWSSLQIQSPFWTALHIPSITQSWVNLLATQKYGIATVDQKTTIDLSSLIKQTNN